MKGFTRKLFSLAVIALASQGGLADTIILKDGRQYDGTITRETPTEVTIETVIANIKAPMKVARAEIDRIIRSDPSEKPAAKPAEAALPKKEPKGKGAKTGEEAAPDEADPFAESDAPANGETRYLVIPIRGVIGKDVLSFAIENCLKGAKARSVKHIVFEVDSPGGMLGEARNIMQVLRTYDRDFTFHALVDRGAISAATVFLAGSKSIHMRPGSSTGAAVAFSRDHSTGAAEVDAKMNSAWASELASLAERNGHAGSVFKAMVVMSDRLYVWKEGEGFRFHDKEPNKDLKLTPTQLDSEKTVLTLTAQDALKWGFAKGAESAAALGADLNCGGWTSIGNAGERAMEQGKRSRTALLDRAEEISKEMKTLLERMKDTEPEAGLKVDQNGRLTPQSMRVWREFTTKLDKMLQSLDDYLVESDKIDTKLKSQGAEYLTPSVQVLRDDVDMRAVIKDKRDWLKRYRNSPPMSK